MPTGPAAARGDIWLADLNPVRGHEQAGCRPVLVVIIPITSTLRNIPFHVVVQPPEGGLTNASALLCEAVRSISKDRLITRWGSVLPTTMAAVEDRLRVLMGL